MKKAFSIISDLYLWIC